MEAETKLTFPHLMHSACRNNRAEHSPQEADSRLSIQESHVFLQPQYLLVYSQNHATGSENTTHAFKTILIIFCQLHLPLQICFFPPGLPNLSYLACVFNASSIPSSNSPS